MPERTNEIVARLVKVTLTDDNNFLKIKETLTRIGVASRKDKTLYQSCHILHKRGDFYIVHFKELFMLDRKPTSFEVDDIGRRNTIAALLEEWSLLTVDRPELITDPRADLSLIKIVPFKEKKNWTLIPKYTIGKKLNNGE
jgi:hypothetical protein